MSQNSSTSRTVPTEELSLSKDRQNNNDSTNNATKKRNTKRRRETKVAKAERKQSPCQKPRCCAMVGCDGRASTYGLCRAHYPGKLVRVANNESDQDDDDVDISMENIDPSQSQSQTMQYQEQAVESTIHSSPEEDRSNDLDIQHRRSEALNDIPTNIFAAGDGNQSGRTDKVDDEKPAMSDKQVADSEERDEGLRDTMAENMQRGSRSIYDPETGEANYILAQFSQVDDDVLDQDDYDIEQLGGGDDDEEDNRPFLPVQQSEPMPSLPNLEPQQSTTRRQPAAKKPRQKRKFTRAEPPKWTRSSQYDHLFQNHEVYLPQLRKAFDRHMKKAVRQGDCVLYNPKAKEGQNGFPRVYTAGDLTRGLKPMAFPLNNVVVTLERAKKFGDANAEWPVYDRSLCPDGDIAMPRCHNKFCVTHVQQIPRDAQLTMNFCCDYMECKSCRNRMSFPCQHEAKWGRCKKVIQTTCSKCESKAEAASPSQSLSQATSTGGSILLQPKSSRLQQLLDNCDSDSEAPVDPTDGNHNIETQSTVATLGPDDIETQYSR